MFTWFIRVNSRRRRRGGTNGTPLFLKKLLFLLFARGLFETGIYTWFTWLAEVVHMDLLDLLIEFGNFSVNIQISKKFYENFSKFFSVEII